MHYALHNLKFQLKLFYLTEHAGPSSRGEDLLFEKWENGGWGNERQVPSGGFRDCDSWQLQVNIHPFSPPVLSRVNELTKLPLLSAVSRGRTPTCTGS